MPRFDEEPYTRFDVIEEAVDRTLSLTDAIKHDVELLHDDVSLLDDEWRGWLTAADELSGGLEDRELAEPFRVEGTDVDTFESTLYDATITFEEAVGSLELERSEANLGNLLEATTAVSTMHVTATNFESELTTAMTASWFGGAPTRAASTVKNWITGRLLPAIRRLSSELWKLLSGLTTLKSWTVSGSLGAGVPGLTGTVGLDLEFGH